MKFWQSMTWAETEQLVAVARFAEELGFEGLMGADHALYPEKMQPNYPYSETGVPPQTADSEYPDMWTSRTPTGDLQSSMARDARSWAHERQFDLSIEEVGPSSSGSFFLWSVREDDEASRATLPGPGRESRRCDTPPCRSPGDLQGNSRPHA